MTAFLTAVSVRVRPIRPQYGIGVGMAEELPSELGHRSRAAPTPGDGALLPRRRSDRLRTNAVVTGSSFLVMTKEDGMAEPARVTYLRPEELRLLEGELDDHERRLRRIERRMTSVDMAREHSLRDLFQLVVVGCIVKRIFR